MTWQSAIRLPPLLPATPEEFAHLGDLAEELLPGGRALVAQLARAEREVLIGMRHLMDARIAELERAPGSATNGPAAGPQPPDQRHKITIT